MKTLSYIHIYTYLQILSNLKGSLGQKNILQLQFHYRIIVYRIIWIIVIPDCVNDVKWQNRHYTTIFI